MAVKSFFSISILTNVKISLPIFIYENNFFMFYNVPLFSVKSAFCNTLIAWFLLIKLIIQQLQTFGWNLKP